MSDLVAAMVAAGGPVRTDARAPRHLHAALVWLGEQQPSSAALPPLVGRPDPDVGLRVQGVTAALWSLAGAGLFRVSERPGGADLLVDEDALPWARRVLMRLSSDDCEAVYAAADRWASASTARKNSARAVSSPGVALRPSDLNCRQSTAPVRRQRAVSSTSPA